MQVVSRFFRAEASLAKVLPAALTSASNRFSCFAGENARRLHQTAPRLSPVGKLEEVDTPGGKRALCTQPNGNQAPQTNYEEMDYQQPTSTVRRRPYNLEAKMRMKQYRRDALHRQRAQEIEDEERNFQVDWSKLYQKGDPGTVQGVIRDINTVGYFVKLPNGREGFLPCAQLGCSGGITLLGRLFKVGDEVTVRVEKMNDGGKDKVYARKDESLGWAQMA